MRYSLASALVAALFFAAIFPALADSPSAAFRDCAECPEVVIVPAGKFTMGTDKGKIHEGPAHGVVFERPFAIGRFEVTFREWEACVTDGGCTRNPDDHGWGRGDRPVINIKAAEAEGYAAWLSSRTGYRYRLPTEAEWEYAARGGTTTEYWWGDAPGANKANCRDCKSEWSAKGSAPVGSFPANPFGLHDTAGNVWEWMADCWNPNHLDAPRDGTKRKGGDCAFRVMKGGSWYYFSRLARSSYRFRNGAEIYSYNIGFRVVREIP
ncbi:MAG: formylglycine-generating enzyme family protein [Rhodospirillales bacterium]|nr:formylglycine-generating enzyme family protein [Rhodospirillales bacterium]MCW8861174.1 formylglycine-generating enzyme family protein [Rhodospirillales bacterium]MCW8951163.1 formylglycine-generating enzyme family protein [Rhodospirillales bacterium]MCW8970965.1 formylglycine-generating enzyme family protein [Rhodospirillales bacterium]MCW9002645.1 formylglycine-generating enzyme family protein [Rhodospirillales bacterium]